MCLILTKSQADWALNPVLSTSPFLGIRPTEALAPAHSVHLPLRVGTNLAVWDGTKAGSPAPSLL